MPAPDSPALANGSETAGKLLASFLKTHESQIRAALAGNNPDGSAQARERRLQWASPNSSRHIISALNLIPRSPFRRPKRERVGLLSGSAREQISQFERVVRRISRLIIVKVNVNGSSFAPPFSIAPAPIPITLRRCSCLDICRQVRAAAHRPDRSSPQTAIGSRQGRRCSSRPVTSQKIIDLLYTPCWIAKFERIAMVLRQRAQKMTQAFDV